MTFEECRGWKDREGPLPEGKTCPPRLEYPSPPVSVEALFVGWNPPGENHFWKSREDKLYRDLSWVFKELGWLTSSDLWKVFRERNYYLVHAVKCCGEANFRWDVPGLIETCAEAMLKQNIADLQPKIICALGEVPHKALRAIWKTAIPRKLRYGEGWCDFIDGTKIIITSFPNWHLNRAEMKTNRECTVTALREYMTGEDSSE